MARVIKGTRDGAQKRAPAQAGGRKVIAREVYNAQRKAQEIAAAAEAERAQRLVEGKRQADQMREEAMAEGAAEAFAQAATEAIEVFRRRAARYSEAAEDVRVLAMEVVRRLIGRDVPLDADTIDRIVFEGIAALRAHRKLRLQVAPARLAALSTERPALLAALDAEPDLLLEDASDVNAGYARVVTEIGGALCAEDTALDLLTDALGVTEAPAPAAVDLEETPALGSPSIDISSLPAAHMRADPEATAFIQAPTQLLDPSAPLAPHALPPDAASADSERTMALDVRQLRAEGLSPADIDLFADDNVFKG